MRSKSGIILSMVLIFTMSATSLVYADGQQNIRTYMYSKDKAEDISCYIKDDVPVPYVAVDDYLGRVYTISFSSEKLEDGTYRISNKRGQMIVDPAKDTIIFDEFERFLYLDGRIDPKDDNQVLYERQEDFSYAGEPKALEMKLGDYDIDIIEEGERVYLPLTTISDIAAITYCSAVYADNAISFNYSLQTPFVNWRNNLNSPQRTAEEAAFTYNELCFVMDHLYVCPSRCAYADDIKNKGFDRTLGEGGSETRLVRDYLLSENTSRFVLGVAILSLMLDDGGHTYLEYILSNGNTAAISGYNNILADPSDPGTALYSKWKVKKQNRIAASGRIKNYLSGYDRYEAVKLFDVKGVGASDRYRYYEYDDTGIFVYTSYDERAVEQFKRALDMAKAHGMKNFVLDESYNYGGYFESAMYMVNALTGENRYFFEGPVTGNIIVTDDSFDMDLDGDYEGEGEDFSYSFNYGVICSAGSYSAGNIMPCLVKKEGIPIIGETSGGGGCYMGEFKMAMGNLYCLAAYATLKTKDGESVEAGAKPDHEIGDYSDFHDFALIDSIMDEHYKNAPTLAELGDKKRAPRVGE